MVMTWLYYPRIIVDGFIPVADGRYSSLSPKTFPIIASTGKNRTSEMGYSTAPWNAVAGEG